jgi:preprotein translocase subunit SecG
MTVILAVLAAFWFVVAIALAIPLLRQRSVR